VKESLGEGIIVKLFIGYNILTSVKLQQTNNCKFQINPDGTV
jgi:hypothetical protein